MTCQKCRKPTGNIRKLESRPFGRDGPGLQQIAVCCYRSLVSTIPPWYAITSSWLPIRKDRHEVRILRSLMIRVIRTPLSEQSNVSLNKPKTVVTGTT